MAFYNALFVLFTYEAYYQHTLCDAIFTLKCNTGAVLIIVCYMFFMVL